MLSFLKACLSKAMYWPATLAPSLGKDFISLVSMLAKVWARNLASLSQATWCSVPPQNALLSGLAAMESNDESLLQGLSRLELYWLVFPCLCSKPQGSGSLACIQLHVQNTNSECLATAQPPWAWSFFQGNRHSIQWAVGQLCLLQFLGQQCGANLASTAHQVPFQATPKRDIMFSPCPAPFVQTTPCSGHCFCQQQSKPLTLAIWLGKANTYLNWYCRQVCWASYSANPNHPWLQQVCLWQATAHAALTLLCLTCAMLSHHAFWQAKFLSSNAPMTKLKCSILLLWFGIGNGIWIGWQ